ncbi:MAG: ubiquinol-cytochrome C chaperone family protein [Pseudomonadota bacterium]
MLKWWKSRTSQSNKADAVYTAVIEQARHPDFYTKFGVPDTMDGRYELIVLHLFLVMERLRGADDETSEIARRTLERFVEDMDDCMREQGVSDLRVPKKVQQAATGFYDRAKMLREHISPDAELGMDAYFSKSSMQAAIWPFLQTREAAVSSLMLLSVTPSRPQS